MLFRFKYCVAFSVTPVLLYLVLNIWEYFLLKGLLLCKLHESLNLFRKILSVHIEIPLPCPTPVFQMKIVAVCHRCCTLTKKILTVTSHPNSGPLIHQLL